MALRYSSVQHGNITLEYTTQDCGFAKATCAHLSEAFASLAEYFALEGELPPMRAILTPGRPEFDRCVKGVLKVDIEAPSNPERVAMPQRTDLVILSPLAYDPSVTEYSPDSYGRLLFHEAVHMVEEYLSPNIEKVPRWWSEGLAVYLSFQWKYEDRERAEVLQGIQTGVIPAIADLSDSAVRLCYVWGWTIVKFVEDTCGSALVGRIVRECADGCVFKVLSPHLHSFECRWRGWLLSGKHGIRPS